MRFSPLRRSDLQRPCSICDGDYQMRRSCFFRSPAWGCCCRSLGEEFVSCSRGYGHTAAAAARGRPAPRCSSARSGTPPPCTPTPSLRWQISWCIP